MHSKLGNVDEALSHLERAVQRGGGNSRDWLVHDRDLDTIRESPRFQAILDAM
jgi:hypothetical protein